MKHPGTPHWYGDLDYCKECGTQIHPGGKCASNACFDRKPKMLFNTCSVCNIMATAQCFWPGCKLFFCDDHLVIHFGIGHNENSDYDEQVSKTLDASPPRSEIAIDKAWERNGDRYKK